MKKEYNPSKNVLKMYKKKSLKSNTFVVCNQGEPNVIHVADVAAHYLKRAREKQNLAHASARLNTQKIEF